MVFAGDGLSMNNENAGLAEAVTRWFRSRQAAQAAGHIDVQGIDHINISVRDLERSLRFYRDLFGFEIVKDGRERKNRPYIILSNGGRAFLALHENAATREPEQPFINHWGFATGDLDEVRRKLRDAGVGVEGDRMHEWEHSRSLYIRDPDGHEIELAEVFGGGN